MILKRTFHPVGHGAFYTEQFYLDENENAQPCFTVVFDCGRFEAAKSGWPYPEYKDAIEKYVSNDSGLIPGEKINLLFISHFHTDHINGIDYILRNYDVRKIILPVITPFVVLDAVSLVQDRSQIGDILLFINNLIKGEFSDKVCSVDILDDSVNDEIDDVDCLGETFNDLKSISKSTRLTYNRWYYKPYYFVDRQKKSLLEKSLQTVFPHIFVNGNLILDKLLNEIEVSGVDAFKQQYKNVFGDNHNSYSVTLFSGISCNKLCHKKCHIKTFDPNRNLVEMENSQLCRVNCLYMGDYIALGNGLNSLKSFYKSEWKNIGMLQVPHHGSEKNSNDELYSDRERICIISSDSNDKYHHPDKPVLDAISRNNSMPIIVSELPKSKQKFTINLP